MKLIFMEESKSDHSAIDKLIKRATASLPDAYWNAHIIVKQSRKADNYIPRLSIVVKHKNKVIGHAALVKTKVKELVDEYACLMLISHHVHPKYQGRGVGSALLESLHERAKGLEYKSIALVGKQDFYGKFGYIRSATTDIIMPPNAFHGQALIKQLAPGRLLKMEGTVELPDVLTRNLDKIENDPLAEKFD